MKKKKIIKVLEYFFYSIFINSYLANNYKFEPIRIWSIIISIIFLILGIKQIQKF